MFSKIFKGKNIISISPFTPDVVNGVTWRINFINQLILDASSRTVFLHRGPVPKNTQSFHESIYGTSNRFIHLFDPCLILKIIFKSKKNMIIFCHTYLTCFYGLFLKIIFRVPFIFDNHNIEFDRFKSSRSPISYFIFLIEYIFIYMSDILIVSSENDKERAKSIFRAQNILVVKNTFSSSKKITENVRPILSDGSDKILLLFFGSMNYAPNKEALLYIQKNIAPFLDANKYLILIAGLYSDIYKSSGLPIKYMGFVQDLDSLILSVDLVIAPIFSGGGVKIKVLQALSLNKYVLTTHEGARGINDNDHMKISNESQFLSDILSFFEHS